MILLAAPVFLYGVLFPCQEYPKDLWVEELVRLKALGFNAVRAEGAGPADARELGRVARRVGLQLWADPPVGRVVRVTGAGNPLFAVREAWASGAKAVLCGSGTAETGTALRRHGTLVRNLGGVLAAVEPRPARWQWGDPAHAALPRGLRLAWLAAPGPRGPAFVSALNYGEAPVAGGVLTIADPRTHRPLVLRRLNLPARQALWMPVNLPLAMPEVCPTCSVFAPDERLVSATAELVAVTFENGVLAMEFVAPGEGELVLELARQPDGPLLAGAKIQSFDWDDKSRRLRIRIPPGKPPDFRSRVGLGIQLPDTSVFLRGPQRLILGSTAPLIATFSSAHLAGRARLLAPAGWRVRQENHAPSEIEYQLEVPTDAVPGDTVTLAVEAEGRVAQSLTLPLVPFCSLRIEPEELFRWPNGIARPVRPHLAATVLPRRRPYRLHLRNHSDEIRTFELTASGEGLEFQPLRVEAVIAGGLEREVSLTAWAPEGRPGLYPWNLRVREGSQVSETPLVLALLSPEEALLYQLDMDRDGNPEWVLENPQIRVVASPRQGGRLLEFRLKGSDVVARESSAPGQPVEARVTGPGQIAVGNRTIALGAGGSFFEVEGKVTVEPAPGVQVEAGAGGRVRVSLQPVR
jgi:hypothetical protein